MDADEMQPAQQSYHSHLVLPCPRQLLVRYSIPASTDHATGAFQPGCKVSATLLCMLLLLLLPAMQDE